MSQVTIHDKHATSFDSLGLGVLLPSNCIVKEELNGMYELELTHPYDEWEKWKRIEEECILYVSTPKGKQPFRIYKTAPTMKECKVYARHVFYDLLDNLCLTVNARGLTPQAFLSAMQNAFDYEMPFLFQTEMAGAGDVLVKNLNPVACLLGENEDTTSFVQLFGGELERDHFTVALQPSIGEDRGFVVAYSKNLVGMEVSEDISEVVTRIYPFGKNGMTIPEGYMDSSHIGDYVHPKAATMDDSNITTRAKLKEAVQAMFDGGCDLPSVNIKVDFVLLSKTEEYKKYAMLEQVFLGDVVTVRNIKMNFLQKSKVISYEWDCLLDQYNGVEIGDFVDDLTSSVSSGKKSLSAAMGASVEVKQMYGLLSGMVTVNAEGLYICVDGTGIDDATKLFHFGTEGLRHSSTGKNGGWKTVINGDGVVI